MPIAVKIVFYGTYRRMTNRESLDLALSPESTLSAALQAITTLYPRMAEELFEPPGNLFPYIPLFLNGRNPRLLEHGMQTILRPGDVLSIFSPIASGRLNVENMKRP